MQTVRALQQSEALLHGLSPPRFAPPLLHAMFWCGLCASVWRGRFHHCAWCALRSSLSVLRVLEWSDMRGGLRQLQRHPRCANRGQGSSHPIVERRGYQGQAVGVRKWSQAKEARSTHNGPIMFTNALHSTLRFAALDGETVAAAEFELRAVGRVGGLRRLCESHVDVEW